MNTAIPTQFTLSTLRYPGNGSHSNQQAKRTPQGLLNQMEKKHAIDYQKLARQQTG